MAIPPDNTDPNQMHAALSISSSGGLWGNLDAHFHAKTWIQNVSLFFREVSHGLEASCSAMAKDFPGDFFTEHAEYFIAPLNTLRIRYTHIDIREFQEISWNFGTQQRKMMKCPSFMPLYFSDIT